MVITRFLDSTAIRNFFLAALFAVAGSGLLLYNFSSTDKSVRAQTGASYTTAWEATDLLVARLMRVDSDAANTSRELCEAEFAGLTSYGDPANSEVAIGPSRWLAKGRIDSTTKFKEIWTTAEIPARITYGPATWDQPWPWFGHCVLGGYRDIKVMGNQNPSDWLIGFAQNSTLNGTAFNFGTKTVGAGTTSISNIDPGMVKNIGKTSSCQYDNRCLFTSGPYSWITFHEFDEANEGKYQSVGMLMPVKWNVTGLICQGGDSRCD